MFKIVLVESSFGYGWGNGYVLLPPDHPWYGMYYDNIPVNIHGGLTCSHALSSRDIAHCKIEDKYLGYYMVGFDTAQNGDTLENWSKEAVANEANRLRVQCEAAYKPKTNK